jgi:hypothetical protein
MASSIMPVSSSNNLTTKLWSAKLRQDTIMGSPILADAISDGIIMKTDDLKKGAGDRVTMPFSKRLTGTGVLGDAPKRPSQTQIQYTKHDLYVDKLSHTTWAKTDGTISQQRTAFDLEEATYPSLSDWFTQRMIFGFFNQIGGNSATSISFDGDTYTGDNLKIVTGLNTATAPTTYRSFYATGSSDANVAGSSSATLTLQAIDALEEEAYTQRSGVNNVIPIIGRPYKFKFYVPRTGYKQLLQQAQASGNITLSQITLSKEAGGTDAAAQLDGSFLYSDTMIVSVPNHYIPAGVTSNASQANTKRAIFVGAEAACLAFGKGFGGQVPGFNILTDEDKIEETNTTAVTGIFGLIRTDVDGYALSSMTYSHYVA